MSNCEKGVAKTRIRGMVQICLHRSRRREKIREFRDAVPKLSLGTRSSASFPSPQFQESVMKRILLLGAAIAIVLVAVAFALQNSATYPLLDWAKKASAGKARVAILLEFG